MYGVGKQAGAALSLGDALAWNVLPSYRGIDADGKEVHDPRVTIVLHDGNTAGAWPVMLKTDDATAGELIRKLKDAAEMP